MVSHNNDRKYYRIAIDTAKEGDEIFNLTEYFKGRVGDRNYGLQMTWYEQGSLKNVKGLKPYIHGNVGHYSIGDDGEIIMAPDASVVSYVGAPGDTDVAGRVVYHFPEQMFPQEGIFYGFLGLLDDSNGDQRLSGVNIWFKVLGGVAYMGKASAYYINEMEKLIHNSEEQIRQLLDQGQKDVDAKQAALQAIVDDYKTKMSDLIERLNAQGQTANSMMETVKAGLSALETKIQQDGLFTQSEAQQLSAKLWSSITRTYKNNDAMVADKSLIGGEVVKTLGFAADGDGGGGYYKMVADKPSTYSLAVANGLYAKPIPQNGQYSAKQFGAGSGNDAQAINAAISAAVKSYPVNTVIVPAGNYQIDQSIILPPYIKMVSTGAVKLNSAISDGSPVLWIKWLGVDDPDLQAYSNDDWQRGPILAGNGGFSLVGQNRTGKGLVIGDDNTGSVAKNLGRYTLSNLSITGFDVGFEPHANNLYIAKHSDLHLENNNINLYISDVDGKNAGENIQFYNCIFAHSKSAIRVQHSSVDLTFNSCSIDFNGIVIDNVSENPNYNIVFLGGNIEGNKKIFDGSAAATDGWKATLTFFGSVIYVRNDMLENPDTLQFKGPLNLNLYSAYIIANNNVKAMSYLADSKVFVKRSGSLKSTRHDGQRYLLSESENNFIHGRNLSLSAGKRKIREWACYPISKFAGNCRCRLAKCTSL